MRRLKPAVRLLSLDGRPREGFHRAASLGAGGVELDAWGPLRARDLGTTARREIRAVAGGFRLEIAAVRAPLRRGLVEPEGMDARLEYLGETVAFAAELGAGTVVLEAGQVPDNPESAGGRALGQSLSHLAPLAERFGVSVALVTGLEGGEVLAKLLEPWAAEVLGVAFDPANWMTHGFDPSAELSAVAARVRIAHARDARKSSPSRASLDVPLGEGDVPWPLLLAHLDAFGYTGWVSAGEAGDQPRPESMAAAIGTLRGWLAGPA